jgi:hypothetical protein
VSKMYSDAFIYGYQETLEKMAGPPRINAMGQQEGWKIQSGNAAVNAAAPKVNPNFGKSMASEGQSLMAATAPRQQSLPQSVMAGAGKPAAPQHAHPKNLNAPGMEQEKAKYSPALIEKWNKQYAANHPGAKGPAASSAKAAPAAPKANNVMPVNRPNDISTGQSTNPLGPAAPTKASPGQVASQVSKAPMFGEGKPADVATGRSMMPGAKAVAKSAPRALDPFGDVTRGTNLPRMFG